MKIVLFLGLLALGYFAGTAAEKKHFKSISEREAASIALPVLSVSKLPENLVATESALVTGSAVISIDYFKRILASLINIVGGKVISYESLVDRARREAILRMKESAGHYDYIINLRIETSVIGNSANQKNGVGSVEVVAFGTAVKVKSDANQI
ncbi:MAG: heavy metal-binding domain-containing protein [Clostridia bacterium]|nr:heavy metal-binding domain-containing protein [Clostridia bacterium]